MTKFYVSMSVLDSNTATTVEVDTETEEQAEQAARQLIRRDAVLWDHGTDDSNVVVDAVWEA